MPCRRATTTTLPPSDSTSASSAAFSAGFHFRRRVMISDPVTQTPSGVLQKDSRQRPTLPRVPTSAQHAAGQTLTALRYGLFDLTRLEDLILKQVAGDFFALKAGENDDA